uniref:Uncharacterized protein n=1 Tax=Anopheles coluzzii TaxID=1518534 RepID=A0A8W7Q3K7_ANOCL
LLDRGLILPVFTVRPVRLDDAADSVHLAVQSAGGNEARQLGIDVVHAHAERVRHVLQRQRAVRLQQLRVRQNAHLAHVVAVVRMEQNVVAQHRLDRRQMLEEIGVLAVVEREQVLLHVGRLVQHLLYFRPLDDLVAQLVARQADHRHVHGVAHERRVLHQLVAGEGADRVEEKVGRRLKVAYRNAVRTLVHLQPVPAVPVAALLDQILGLVDVARDQIVIEIEQPDADLVKHDVEPVAERNRLLVRLAERRYRALLVADPAQVLRFAQVRLPHLHFAQILLRVLDGGIELLQLLAVRFPHLGQLLLVDGPAQIGAHLLVPGGHIFRLDRGQQLLRQLLVAGKLRQAEQELAVRQLQVGVFLQALLFQIFDRHDFTECCGNGLVC